VRKKYPNYLTDDGQAKLLYRDLRTRLDGIGVNKEMQKKWIKHLWPDDDDDEKPSSSSSGSANINGSSGSGGSSGSSTGARSTGARSTGASSNEVMKQRRRR